jgi:hypothetical protein
VEAGVGGGVFYGERGGSPTPATLSAMECGRCLCSGSVVSWSATPGADSVERAIEYIAPGVSKLAVGILVNSVVCAVNVTRQVRPGLCWLRTPAVLLGACALVCIHAAGYGGWTCACWKPRVFHPPHLCSCLRSLQPPEVVTEGRPFPVQPIVTVTDCSGRPLANRDVFALLVQSNGARLPLLLLPADDTGLNVKLPVNIVASTNAAGEARFSRLGFQVRSPSPAPM